MKVEINRLNCRACLKCVGICPQGAIKIVAGFPAIDEDKCIGCGICVKNCPFGAIEFRFKEDKIGEIKGKLNEIAHKINFIQERLNNYRR